MSINMTKVANIILYMLHKQVKHLNDKKVSIMLFLIDYNHLNFCGAKITNDRYIKSARYPQPVVLSEIFEIIANEEDLDENDERIYLIQEMLDFLDIEICPKDKFCELNFIKLPNEDFDESIFSKDEMKTIHKIVSLHKDTSARNLANECFNIESLRKTPKGEFFI